MDRAFLLEGLKALIPITLIFCVFFVFTPMTGDFQFHMENIGKNADALDAESHGTPHPSAYDYPPAVSWLLSFSQVVLHLDRKLALFLLLLSSTTFIPYILITRIVGKKKKECGPIAGWIYLYGSGVPFLTLWGGVAAQALIVCFMLFCVLEPIGLFLLLILGPYIYREWLLAFGATFVYIAFQYLKPKIATRWYD
jgi:hypothetical protein